MDTAAATTPNFDSGFPVDFTFIRTPASNSSWYTGARLISGKLLHTDTNSAAGNHSEMAYYDFNEAYGGGGWWDANVNQAWMWKRHAGFDVVAYKGNSVSGTQISHSMNRVPQMIWIKCRNDTKDWQVGHHGANGGTNPWNYYLELNQSQAEASQEGIWNNTAPTSTGFTLGNWSQVNNSSGTYLAMLFSSVDGISKVGYYNGTGSSGHSITTGFQPRFIITKVVSRPDGYGGSWNIFDTVRGINSGNEYPLRLDTNEAQTASNHLDYIDLDSNGFTIVSTHQNYNYSGAKYIYYAHA
jgi:hypothetical protein